VGSNGAYVGAGSPEFIPPTNNLPKPAPTQRLNGMNWQFFGVNGAGLDRDVGRDGAGFLGYLFGGEDIGEPAPTGIMWCN
jgi:hypothetical protein